MSAKARNLLIFLSLILILAVALACFGIAYAGGIRGKGLLGFCFFFTGGIVVILAQLIPAGILFSSFVGTAFSFLRKRETPIRTT